MNPFASLVRSRKFWLAVLDAGGGIIALWVGAYVAEPTRNLILATWAALQPVFVAIIAAIAYEDAARARSQQ